MSDNSVQIEGARLFITGANRGIGLGFAETALERGAAKIYAGARKPDQLDELVARDPDRIVPVKLDVNDPAQRRNAVRLAADVNILINNSGISGSSVAEERRFLSASNLEDARLVMETNYFAPSEMARLFTPSILEDERGAIVNIISIGALFCVAEYATYSASKAAAMMMSNGIRAELDRRSVLVASVYTAGVDTRMSAGNPGEKSSPTEHANEVFDALQDGREHIYAGAGAEALREQITADPIAFERRCIDRLHDNPLG